ncbi:glycosyltransferase family 8 protein [Actinobacillus porcinus]|uniref:glycosyltransferase family 8 protein n=1 Tax=Actinobacillus porcinus TaxID=51048 RepID=UPI002A90A66B|nr:glycosyltransferase family 8 protein [Actinobacillus porcinus]MDY6214916.1 glycosyltransferase family 8 protein [Actinobacillus porcinus]
MQTNKQTNKQTIFLAANERYTDKVLTTIKSVCFHNRNIDFYLLNKDISPEWFDYVNHFLVQVNSFLFDVKVNYQLEKYKTYEHINSETTYFRYFISEVINDRNVLYLDSDLVVNGSLEFLFDIDLTDYFVAGSLDDLAHNFYQNEGMFNAGVLLINTKLWHEQNIPQLALNITDKYSEELRDGDQEVLNLLFKGKWLELNNNINYLVGAEYLYNKNDLSHFIHRPANIPLILHFNTAYKPWLIINDLPFREYYWYYYRLTFEQIIQKHKQEI